MASGIDMIKFALVLDAARDAYKMASSASMRELICDQVGMYVKRILSARECLDELGRIADLLYAIQSHNDPENHLPLETQARYPTYLSGTF